MAPVIHNTAFTKITENLLGAEGPVFVDKNNFLMVAPEVEKNGKPAGQILKIDLKTGKVRISEPGFLLI